MSFPCVYVLRCTKNKYYVGNTRNFAQRMEDHFTTRRQQKWTALYKPLKLIAVYKTTGISYNLEKWITLLYITRYGFENVAGYVYCSDMHRNAFRRKIDSIWHQPLESKMPFTIPAIQSKSIAPSTLAQYKARLNKLVSYGYSTVQDILDNPAGIIDAVNELFPGIDPSPKHQPTPTCRCEQCKLRENKRYFYTAIFYVLADTEFIKSPNPLYHEFQKQKQNYNSHAGYDTAPKPPAKPLRLKAKFRKS